MRFLLIRHPAPLVAPHTCYGASDIDADPAALADALMALQPLLHDESALVRSSPLRRCTALAVPLAARLRAPPPLLDARLAEMDFGDWELRPWDSIARREIDAWAVDPVRYAPGGGETVLQVAARIADFLEEAMGQPDAAHIVVCHAGTIRLLAAMHAAAPATIRRGGRLDRTHLEAVALQAAASPNAIAYASLLTLQF